MIRVDLPAGDTTDSGQRKLGDYVIVREVGRGGMGVVYEAEQQTLGRRVAIKVLSSRSRLNPHQVRRFDREARSVARLEHPAIVPVYGIGKDQTVPFYVMKFINGQGLDDVLRELRKTRELESAAAITQAAKSDCGVITNALVNGSEMGEPNSHSSPTLVDSEPISLDDYASDLSAALRSNSKEEHEPRSSVFSRLSKSGSGNRTEYFNAVARIGLRVAEALHYAHSQGVLHRDIKPSNLMLDPLGQVWVTDFGLAKIAHEEDITHTGEFVGTLRYTSPEQLTGWSDPRSDVYSLGVTLYEMLTLRPAFVDDQRPTLIHRITNEDPKPIRHLAPEVPHDLAMIVEKAISKEPSLRYHSAQLFADDLERYLDNKPVHAKPFSVDQQIRLWARRNPAVATLSSLLSISVVVALFAVSWLWQRAVEQKSVAQTAAEGRQLALQEMELALEKAESTAEALAEMILAGDAAKSGTYSVHQMLLDYEQRLDQRFDRYPKLKAKLRYAIGTVMHSRNEITAAEANLKDAILLYGTAGMDNSLEQAAARELLANVYRLKRDNASAAEQLKQAIAIRSRELGPDHPNTLSSRVFYLAALRVVSPSILSNEEILAELEEISQRLALQLDDESCRDTYLHARFYAITVTNRIGKFDKSEQYCQERLRLLCRKHEDEPNHPSIVYALQQMAECKRLQQNFSESANILRDAQQRTRNWFAGEVSPQEIDLLVEEAETHFAASDYEATESTASREHCDSQRHIFHRTTHCVPTLRSW